MTYSTELRELLEKHEGKRNRIYEDSEGVATIGIGHNLNEPLPDEVIYLLFEHDVNKHEKELDRCLPGWRKFSKNRKIALVSMIFVLGAPTFMEFHKMRRALMLNDFETAAEEMLDSKWGRKYVTRVTELSELLRAG